MKSKLNNLTFLDLILLTVILFGTAIFNSNFELIDSYFSFSESITEINSDQFSDTQNITALFLQLIYLAVGIAYLRWRQFDFKQLTFKFSWQAIMAALLLFLLIALLMDLYFFAIQYWDFYFNYEAYQQQLQESATLNDELLVNEETFSTENFFSFWLFLYSLFNGFYEEVFFLGLCLCVKPSYQKWAFLYSLLIRFSFHTYQGIESALGITLILGVIFYVLWKRSATKNLVPFSLAHSLGDIFGVGILAYFYY